MEPRTFEVGDIVVYKPFENCSKVDISGAGKIIEVLGDGMYTVTFGDYNHTYKSAWRNTGKFGWSNLYPYNSNDEY